MRGAAWLVVTAAALAALSACDPFGPATRALENGATGLLTSATSMEIAGDYTQSDARWTIDLQIARPTSRHVLVSNPQGEKVEAIIVGRDAYFRGQQFLARHLGSDPLSQSLAKAAGNAWWKDTADLVPSLQELTDGGAFRSTFLGSAVTQRTDHQLVDGVDTVELSGARADVFIASAPPYALVRVHLQKGAVIDGIADADLHFSNFDHDFRISPPADVINFSNLSTLPPIYTVVSVDTSGCGSPCVVTAKVKNLGGLIGASAPSTVTFTMTDPASKKTLGTCQARVQPDVGYNSTTTVSCTVSAQAVNAAVITAVADNPGRA